VKPAPQCPKWDKADHRTKEPHCPFWHPRVICNYYPNCQLTAQVCGYAHPFCGDVCKCDPKNRSLQKNHNVVADVSKNKQNVEEILSSQHKQKAQEVSQKKQMQPEQKLSEKKKKKR